MLKKIKNLKNSLFSDLNEIKGILNNDINSPKINLGQIQICLNKNRDISNIQEAEFKIFSQWGDDGIIQHLLNNIEIENKVFIEFGVENYKESNTRFLLINNNWSGLVIDGSEQNIKYIKKDKISWAYDLHAVCKFITKDNINSIINDFVNQGYHRNIGILSIDIDGNDYHIWKEINVIEPTIVIVEYNSIFGFKNTWSIPYDSNFKRLEKHNSYQYWGASLKALKDLGKLKGYSLVGCNSNGNNAYFVKTDKLNNIIKELTAEEAFVFSKFREDLLENDERVSIFKRLDLIKDMTVLNTQSNSLEKI